jgi:hypothetical protein
MIGVATLRDGVSLDLGGEGYGPAENAAVRGPLVNPVHACVVAVRGW